MKMRRMAQTDSIGAWVVAEVADYAFGSNPPTHCDADFVWWRQVNSRQRHQVGERNSSAALKGNEKW